MPTSTPPTPSRTRLRPIAPDPSHPGTPPRGNSPGRCPNRTEVLFSTTNPTLRYSTRRFEEDAPSPSPLCSLTSQYPPLHLDAHGVLGGSSLPADPNRENKPAGLRPNAPPHPGI